MFINGVFTYFWGKYRQKNEFGKKNIKKNVHFR